MIFIGLFVWRDAMVLFYVSLEEWGWNGPYAVSHHCMCGPHLPVDVSLISIPFLSYQPRWSASYSSSHASYSSSRRAPASVGWACGCRAPAWDRWRRQPASSYNSRTADTRDRPMRHVSGTSLSGFLGVGTGSPQNLDVYSSREPLHPIRPWTKPRTGWLYPSSLLNQTPPKTFKTWSQWTMFEIYFLEYFFCKWNSPFNFNI